jgi:predicted LPLAT superfamily acyltransferase
LLIRELRKFYKFVFSFKKRFRIVDFVFLKYVFENRFFFVKIQSNFKSIRSVKQQWFEDFLLRTIQSMQYDTFRHFQRFRERISDRAFANCSHRVKRKEVKISADIEFSLN